MLGVALDPGFATNGYVYLLYTFDVNQLTPDSTSPTVSRLTRSCCASARSDGRRSP